MNNIIYIDTHAHLFSDNYSMDLDAVLLRAEQAGVKFIIVPATDLNTSRMSIQLAEKYRNIFSCIGIHPHESAKVKNIELYELEELCKHPKVVAIGEIGLDYHYDFSPQARQKEIFYGQLSLAVKKNLPVVVHTRKSEEDIFRITQNIVEENPNWKYSKSKPKRGVFHCFPGTAEIAINLYKHGFYVSYPGIVTFKNSESIEVIKKIGIDKIMLETDSPYMAPVPFRGKRNEPANIVYIGKKISESLNISEAEVASVTTENAIDLFCIGL